MLMDDIAFFRYVLVILLVSFGFFWILLDMCKGFFSPNMLFAECFIRADVLAPAVALQPL